MEPRKLVYCPFRLLRVAANAIHLTANTGKMPCVPVTPTLTPSIGLILSKEGLGLGEMALPNLQIWPSLQGTPYPPRIRLLDPWFGSKRFKGKDHTAPLPSHSTWEITEVRKAKVTGSRQVVARPRASVCRPAGRAMRVSWHGLPESPEEERIHNNTVG